MEPVLKPIWNLYVLSCLVLSCLAPDFCLALICLDFMYFIKEEFCIKVANVKNQPPNFKQLIPCA